MNQLAQVAEFRVALAHYTPSTHTKQVLTAARLVLLVGPTSSGRNTIVNELTKTGRYYHIVSDTTREKRTKDGVVIERDGREYWFKSEAEIFEGLKRGEYIEADLIHNQQVSGCNVRELEAAVKAEKIAVKDIEPDGAQNIHRVKPDALIIFTVPPSFDIWMERIHARSQMALDELDRRMESAAHGLAMALKSDFYRFVLNDTIAGTTTEIDTLVTTGQYDPFKERVARDASEKLYRDVERYLANRAPRSLD